MTTTGRAVGDAVSGTADRVSEVMNPDGGGNPGGGGNGGGNGNGGNGPGRSEGNIGGPPNGFGGSSVGSAPGLEGPSSVLRSLLNSVITTEATQSGSPTVTDPSGTRAASIESLIASAIETAKAFAFPLILMALVLLFLGAQNRMDREETKFVLAPLSAEEDLLSFQ